MTIMVGIVNVGSIDIMRIFLPIQNTVIIHGSGIIDLLIKVVSVVNLPENPPGKQYTGSWQHVYSCPFSPYEII